MKANFKLFMSYVLPSIIGILIVGSYSIVDSIFIGQYGGKTGLAAVSLTWPLVMLFGALGDMLGTGAGILISQSRGAGNLSKARQIFGNMFFLQLIVCLATTIPCIYYLKDLLIFFGANDTLLPISLPYAIILVYGSFAAMMALGLASVIRNDGRPALAMIITSISLILNLILDYLFIFIFDTGLEGAAWATLIAQITGGGIALIYFATPWTSLRYGKDMWKIKSGMFNRILISGVPTLGTQLSIIGMLFLHNYQSLKYGGVDGLAVYTFIGAVESVGSLFMTGLALGVQPLVAYLYGQKKFKEQNIIGNMGYLFAFISGLILVCFSILGRNIFPTWFNLSNDVLGMASHGLLISSTAFVLLGVIRVAGFYYQATGKIKEASLLIYGDACFALPLCLFILPLWFGLDGVWLAMPVSRVLLFGCVCYLWLKNKSNPFKYHH